MPSRYSLENQSCLIQAEAQTTNEKYGIAAGHYERQEYDQAIEKFREVIEQFPSTRQAAISYFFLGESFVQKSDYQSAFPAYQIFLERLPFDKYARRAEFRLGECAFRLGWGEKASTFLEDYFESYPNDRLNEFVLTYLGELRIKRNEPQLAIQVLERALSKFPDSANVPRNRFSLARAMQSQKRYEDALRFYEMIASNQNNVFAGQAKMQMGVIHYLTAHNTEAQATLKEAVQWLAADQHLPEAQYWLAKTEIVLGNFQTAFEHLSKAIENTTNKELKAAILFDGAIAASKSDNTDIALAWISQLEKTWPNSQWADDVLQLKIELLFQKKRFDDANIGIDRFETEFNHHDNLATILEYKGRIQYERNEFKSTVKTFENLLDQFGETTANSSAKEVWSYFKSLGQVGMKNYEMALETLESLDAAEPESEFAASVLLAKASCCVGLKRSEEAVNYLKQYLATSPTGTSADRARSDLSLALVQSNQWDAAEQTVTDFEQNHTDADLLFETKLLIAELALQDKRYDLSENYFMALTNNANPRKYVVRGLSGVAWVRLTRGDEESSVEVFERLVKEHGETGFAAEAAMACGKHFEQNKQHDKAIDMYRHVQDKFSDSNFVSLAKLREAYNLYKTEKQANLVRAESILLAYKNSETKFLDEATYQLAWLYLESDREDESSELFKKIVDDYPDSKYWTDAAYRVAQFAITDQDFDIARALVVRLYENDLSPEIKTRTLFLKGQLAVQDETWAVVETTMQDVLATTDDESIRKKSRYWLAEAMFQLEQYDNAVIELDRLIGNPDLITEQRLAWVNLRRVQCFAYEEEWTEALQSAEAGKKQFPDFEAAYEFDFIAGRAHAAQGRLVEARQAYQSVIDSPVGSSTQTAAMAQWRIGETYFHQENFERAIESYYRVDSLYGYKKWRAAALVEAGKCQEHLGNWNHAVKLYAQLIEKFPESEFRVAAEHRMQSATRQAQRIEENINK